MLAGPSEHGEDLWECRRKSIFDVLSNTYEISNPSGSTSRFVDPNGRFVVTRPSVIVVTDPDISQPRVTRVLGRPPPQTRLKIEPEIRRLTTLYSPFLQESGWHLYPSVRVTILDRPEVIELAQRQQPGNRVGLMAEDLFDPLGVEGDAVVMARVLHDWDDAPALCLLRRARSALPVGGQLFVVEMIVTEGYSTGGLSQQPRLQ